MLCALKFITTLGTAGYFQRLGLLSKEVDATDKETEINILMNMAVNNLPFLPFGYLVTKYRWDLYRDVADEKSLNCHWVKLRMDIQGKKRFTSFNVMFIFK